MKDRSTSHLRIYVGGLTDKTTVDDLYEHFIQYGQINGIIVNKNFGFVQFDVEQSAQNAISKANGSNLKGRAISVRTAQTNPDKSRQTEVVTVQSSIPPAVALSDNLPVVNDDAAADEPYDSYGNFKGDQSYGEENYEDNYNQSWEGRESTRGGRGRGAPRGRGRGGRGRGGPGFRDRSPIPGRGGFDRFSHQDYSRPISVTERNDCEIIVVSKSLT
ncbi:unnamed protein product [Diatraea saccharalis]|nr:unnamed protein product [Diatraea saccharalis]